jgi:hypothetical protein
LRWLKFALRFIAKRQIKSAGLGGDYAVRPGQDFKLSLIFEGADWGYKN